MHPPEKKVIKKKKEPHNGCHTEHCNALNKNTEFDFGHTSTNALTSYFLTYNFYFLICN